MAHGTPPGLRGTLRLGISRLAAAKFAPVSLWLALVALCLFGLMEAEAATPAPPLSINAHLSSLTLSAGTLSPPFDSSNTVYLASVSNSIGRISVTAIAAETNATIRVRINGGSWSAVSSGISSCSLSLNVGDNVIEAQIPTDPDGTTIKGYRVTVNRAQPAVIIVGMSDFQNGGLWRKEVRKHELARCQQYFNWTTVNSIWFDKRAASVWIRREALETFSYDRRPTIHRFPNGRIWVIWRYFKRTDLRRFHVHYRFWWAGLANPLLSADDPDVDRMMMSTDEVLMVFPMTPSDPNPSTPFNEAVQIMDENGQQHFQGQPGFEQMPDIANNPNGFQVITTAMSTDGLPPAADRIRDLPMPPPPGTGQSQPGVFIEYLVDRYGNVLADHDTNGCPDPVTSSRVLGGQKHQGLVATPTGTVGTELIVDQGNGQLQLHRWELDENGEVLGAQPGQRVIGPPVDLDSDGVVDNAIGAPVPLDPTVRELVVQGGSIQELRDPNAKPVDLAVVEGPPPTDAQLADFNARMAAQIPGFMPLQRPFVLGINRIRMRRMGAVERRFVFDTRLHHWTWQHRNQIPLTSRPSRVWLTKLSLSDFSYSRREFPVGQASTSNHYSLTDVRFFRSCSRVVAVAPNQVLVKIDQMHVVVPVDPSNPNSQLLLLSTQGDENKLFQEVPPAVLAGLQPDPLPVGPDGTFVEPIDPVTGTLDISIGGTGVFQSSPQETRGMYPAMLSPNEDTANAPKNNQLQLYCWQLNPNGTLASETFAQGFGLVAAPQMITFAMTPTPALPVFEDENGSPIANPTRFLTTLTAADNKANIEWLANGRVRISWEGIGQLQAASAAAGSYQDIFAATNSPVLITPAQARQFYRLRR